MFYNNEHHYEIGIKNFNGEKMVFVRRRIGDLWAVVVQEKVQDKSIILSIEASEKLYTFGYGYEKSEIKSLATGTTRYVSVEASKLDFTGVFFAMYATGNGKMSESQANFNWFDYVAE